MSHLLVTNDYPPKIGGIQNYLFELWRRLAPERFTVLTRDHPGSATFDPVAPHRIERLSMKVLWPLPRTRRAIIDHARASGADLIVLDPVVPLGILGPSLKTPYALILHGAELTIPARVPALRPLVRAAILSAELLIVGGRYPEEEVHRLVGPMTPPIVLVPPGVDTTRFHPLEVAERRRARERLGVSPEALLVASVSRLVPRKGMDVLIEAAARLAPEHPGLEVVIGGAGRDAKRLARLLARTRAPVRLIGHVPERDLPSLAASADVWAMLCRNRWLGLEQEGFGIVFLEGAAAGVAQLAGRSGGAQEAVLDGETGLVVDRPGDVARVAEVLGRLIDEPGLRDKLGRAARARVVEEFSYDRLAAVLGEALAQHGG